MIIKKAIIGPPNLTFTYQRVIWLFKGGKHNQVMEKMLKEDPCTVILKKSGMILRNKRTMVRHAHHPERSRRNEDWQVKLDKEGNVLRANGLFYFGKGKRLINALQRKDPYPYKRYVPFWTIVFQQDQAPIEGKKEKNYAYFREALKSFIEEKDLSLFGCYTKVQIGERGIIELEITENEKTFIWGLTLMRKYDLGEEVLFAPLLIKKQFLLGIYDANNFRHLYTLNFDFQKNSFYRWKILPKGVCKEFFMRIPSQRCFSFANLNFYLSKETDIGGILILEEDENGKIAVRLGHQSKFKPLYNIEKEGQTVGYLLGERWGRSPFQVITGKINKKVKIHWNKDEKVYGFEILGKIYWLSESNVQYLEVKDKKYVFVTLEDSRVIEVESDQPEKKIFFKIVRDKNFKILNSTRAAIPHRYLLEDGIRIIEGLETVENKNKEAVIIGKKYFSLQEKATEPFQRRPVSLVIKVERKRIKILYYSFSPRFSSEERKNIDMIIEDNFIKLRDLHGQERKKMARDLSKIFGKTYLSLMGKLDNFRTYLESKCAADIVHILDLINEHEKRMRMYDADPVLEVFASLHIIFSSISPQNQQKILSAFSLMMKFENTKELLLFILKNSLSGGTLGNLIKLFSQNPDLEKEILRVMSKSGNEGKSWVNSYYRLKFRLSLSSSTGE